MKLDNQKEPENYSLGWWPEIAGAIAVSTMLWFLFSYAQGI
ncbi:hypothetical protein [Vibrio sonorensis]|nr:hypothetical protein [Vibrio sonorensis]